MNMSWRHIQLLSVGVLPWKDTVDIVIFFRLSEHGLTFEVEITCKVSFIFHMCQKRKKKSSEVLPFCFSSLPPPGPEEGVGKDPPPVGMETVLAWGPESRDFCQLHLLLFFPFPFFFYILFTCLFKIFTICFNFFLPSFCRNMGVFDGTQ